MSQKLPPRHLGDGAYVHDEGFQIALAVNHHENKVLYLDASAYKKLVAYVEAKIFTD